MGAGSSAKTRARDFADEPAPIVFVTSYRENRTPRQAFQPKMTSATHGSRISIGKKGTQKRT